MENVTLIFSTFVTSKILIFIPSFILESFYMDFLNVDTCKAKYYGTSTVRISFKINYIVVYGKNIMATPKRNSNHFENKSLIWYFKHELF